MDREILSIYLQSGPARKLDVCRFTAEIASSGGSNESYLFQNKFLNNSILFKCVIPGDYAGLPHEKPISTLIYMPYDTRRPDKGGESFVFSTKSFSRYCAHKVHAKNIGLTAMERDLEVLRTLDSLPTFSPLIVELAFERNNMTIPSAYVDLTPELRNKLRAQLKGRIRPLIVAAYDRSSISVEKAVEEMTNKLFYLKNIREILPLVQALHLEPKNAAEFLSSWIGVTYFEYEYSMLQAHLKEFAGWLAKPPCISEYTLARNINYMYSLIDIIKSKLRIDWKRISQLSNEYREAYHDLVYDGEITKFSNFLGKCKYAYWELGDLLGRFEQTVIAWRVFKSTYHGNRVPFPVLANFFTLLRKLHEAPKQRRSRPSPRRRRSRFHSNLAPDLF